MDKSLRITFYRSKRAIFMTPEMQKEFCNGVIDLLLDDLNDLDLMRKCAKGPRGPHFPCIMGHAQQYQSVSF